MKLSIDFVRKNSIFFLGQNNPVKIKYVSSDFTFHRSQEGRK